MLYGFLIQARGRVWNRGGDVWSAFGTPLHTVPLIWEVGHTPYTTLIRLLLLLTWMRKCLDHQKDDWLFRIRPIFKVFIICALFMSWLCNSPIWPYLVLPLKFLYIFVYGRTNSEKQLYKKESVVKCLSYNCLTLSGFQWLCFYAALECGVKPGIRPLQKLLSNKLL